MEEPQTPEPPEPPAYRPPWWLQGLHDFFLGSVLGAAAHVLHSAWILDDLYRASFAAALTLLLVLITTLFDQQLQIDRLQHELRSQEDGTCES